MMTWNINGMNSPPKRRVIFQLLKKQKCSLICLQEVHIKHKENKLLKNEQLGNPPLPRALYG